MYRNLYMLSNTIYSILKLKKGIKMNVDKCKTCNYCSDKIRKGPLIVSHRYTCLLGSIRNCEDVPLDRCRYSKDHAKFD